MYTLVKELRGKDLDSLRNHLQGKLSEMEETWDGLAQFRLHGMNRYFVKFLLSRITGFIEQQSGASTSFSTYFVSQSTMTSISGRTSLESTVTSLSNNTSLRTTAIGSAIWCCCHKAPTNPMEICLTQRKSSTT